MIGFGLASIFALLAIFDSLDAVTLEWLALAVAILLAGCALLIGAKASHASRVLVGCLFLGALMILRAVELSPVKPFRVFYHELSSGLSRSEVESRVQRHFAANGRYRAPEMRTLPDGSMLLTLDPSDGRYNAEILHLSFRDGRLSAATYSPD